MLRRFEMRGLWLAVSALVVGGAVWASAPAAEAHDGCGSYRVPCHPSTRVVVPRRGHCGCGYRYGYRGLRGGSWIALRRGLGQGSFYDPTRRWVRDHYLRRFPFTHLVAGEEAERMRILLSDDLLAVMSEEQGKDAVLDTGTRLDRAAARFFAADYDGAREDLLAVLADNPKEPRAKWGLFLAAVCKSEWQEAGTRLKALAEAGEIKPGDRLDPDRTFADPKVFPSIVRGLRTYSDMRISDGTAYVVTAWALSSQGDLNMAKRYLTLARRWDADATTTAALGRAFEADGKAKPKAKEPAKEKGQIRRQEQETPSREQGERNPDEPALERQIAKAPKATTRVASR